MRLTSYTDFSLRVLMYVAVKPQGLSTIREIASAYGISQNHLMKVVFELGREGILETVRGRSGGVRLARPAEHIRIGDVVRFTEAGSAIVECFGATGGCIIAAPCRLKHVLKNAQDAFLSILDGYTLADLVGGNGALADIFQAA
jgi:Rrf2 family transcriptional regulator, nitric oxide-sensitive transcriptional repressor